VSKPTIFSNTLTNGLSSVINAIITVVLTPILISKLGSENYGLWSLLLSASYTYGYLGIGDLGLGEFMLRSVPGSVSEGQSGTKNLAYLTSNSLAASFLGGLASIGVAATIVFLISRLGVSNSFDSRVLLLCISLILCEAFFEIICSIFRGFIEGQARFKIARTIDTSGRILWGMSASLILFNGGGVVQLALATAFISLSRLSAYIYCSRLVDQPLIFEKSLISRVGILTVIKGGLHLNGLRALYSIYSQMDRSIIAIFLTVAAITTYDISFRFFSVTVLLLATASSAVIPTIAQQYSNGDFDANRSVLLKGTSITTAIVIPICLGLFFYAPSIIQVWIGPGHLDAVTPARIFLLFPILLSTNQIGIAMLTAVGKTKTVLKFQFYSVFMNLALSIVFVQFLGLKGVVIGTLFSNVFLWFPYSRLILRTFNTSLNEWISHLLRPILVAVVTQTIFFLISCYAFEIGDISNIIYCALTTLVSILFGGVVLQRHNHFSLKPSRFFLRR
jgi:O-antigen/teichoic acid export membrane protein